MRVPALNTQRHHPLSPLRLLRLCACVCVCLHLHAFERIKAEPWTDSTAAEWNKDRQQQLEVVAIDGRFTLTPA